MVNSLRLDHISLSVRDLDISARFYAEVLGLPEIENKTGKATRRWFGLDHHLAIHLVEARGSDGSISSIETHFALTTSKFEDAIQHLASKGVQYGDLSGEPGKIHFRADGKRQVYFQDPDGHWIEINES